MLNKLPRQLLLHINIYINIYTKVGLIMVVKVNCGNIIYFV